MALFSFTIVVMSDRLTSCFKTVGLWVMIGLSVYLRSMEALKEGGASI